MAAWRTTPGGWVWQHLVSAGHPLMSRTVLLGGLVDAMRKGIGDSLQNWFRPDNRFPARVFGTMTETVGETYSSVQPRVYFAVPRRIAPPRDGSVRIVRYDRAQHQALGALARVARGPVYVRGEGLEDDVDLRSIDSLYRTVGLQRMRHVWLAHHGRTDVAVGAAVAYRGPLGLNFSFIENRCELLLRPSLSAAEASAVTTSLVAAAQAAYAEFELDDIPVVADSAAAAALTALGGEFLRNYSQGILLKEGQPLFFRHVDQFYVRLRSRLQRRAVPSTLSA
jgi:hypothetical protein